MNGNKMDTIKIRQMNRENTFEYIKQNPYAARADISRELNLSFPTVTSIITELEEAGLVRAEKSMQKTGGRSSMAYCCNENAGYSVGIQLSERYMKGVLLNLMGEITGEIIVRKIPFASGEDYRHAVGGLYRDLLKMENVDEEKVLGAGITLEGFTDPEGEKIELSFTEGLAGTRREELTKYIPVPTRLFHDMTAAGYNQKLRCGENVFYLSLNSSIGGTVLAGGEIYSGCGNKAGEIGHMRLKPGGRSCYCGNKGCFDAYCNTLRLKDLAGGELQDFFDGLDAGKEEYISLWEEYMEYLSAAVFNIRMLFDGIVLIGGELSRYSSYFLDELRRRMNMEELNKEDLAGDYIKVLEDGDNVIVTGAAMYFINQAPR